MRPYQCTLAEYHRKKLTYLHKPSFLLCTLCKMLKIHKTCAERREEDRRWVGRREVGRRGEEGEPNIVNLSKYNDFLDPRYPVYLWNSDRKGCHRWISQYNEYNLFPRMNQIFTVFHQTKDFPEGCDKNCDIYSNVCHASCSSNNVLYELFNECQIVKA